MIGTTDFFEMVTLAFASVCQQFSLSVKEIAENEIAIQGRDFVLLAWLDRDGVSVKYVDISDQEGLAVIDLGSFLATKRSWIVDESIPARGDFESQIRRGLFSYAKTLRAVASDILEGKKQWLTDVSDQPMRLSEKHEELIRAAIA